MNMLKRTLGIVSLLLITPLLAESQAMAQPKIGYTNQEAILANMPEMQQVQQKLEQRAQTMRQEMQQEQQQLQEMIAKYQKQQALLSDERKAEREQELRQQQQRSRCSTSCRRR